MLKEKFNFEPRWFAVVIFFFTGVFTGALILFIWVFNGGKFYGIQRIHPARSNYTFINPLLAVNVSQPSLILQSDNIKVKIQSLIQKGQASGQLTNAAFYFQEIESGRWFSINEDTKYLLGKFLKVPIMIAYFKEAEANPEVLNKKLVYKIQPGDSSGGDQADMREGKSYPVEDFIKDMILHDSDSSAIILFDNIDKSYLNEVYSDLGIGYQEDKTTDDYLTVKFSSLFYRVLYNSTYLSPQYSEEALNIISQGNQGIGLARALPNDMLYAHRNPGIVQIKNSSLLQDTDCGIFYFPNHPYILCGLATGKNPGYLEGFLSQVGQQVYQNMVDKYKHEN